MQMRKVSTFERGKCLIFFKQSPLNDSKEKYLRLF